MATMIFVWSDEEVQVYYEKGSPMTWRGKRNVKRCIKQAKEKGLMIHDCR